jgi:hypothetical protein
LKDHPPSECHPRFCSTYDLHSILLDHHSGSNLAGRFSYFQLHSHLLQLSSFNLLLQLWYMIFNTYWVFRYSNMWRNFIALLNRIFVISFEFSKFFFFKSINESILKVNYCYPCPLCWFLFKEMNKWKKKQNIEPFWWKNPCIGTVKIVELWK